MLHVSHQPEVHKSRRIDVPECNPDASDEIFADSQRTHVHYLDGRCHAGAVQNIDQLHHHLLRTRYGNYKDVNLTNNRCLVVNDIHDIV